MFVQTGNDQLRLSFNYKSHNWALPVCSSLFKIYTKIVFKNSHKLSTYLTKKFLIEL